MKPEIVLVRLKGHKDLKETADHLSEPLGLQYLASYLRENGHSVSIIDGLTSWRTSEEVVGEILKANPKIVGFTITFQEYIQENLRVASILVKSGLNAHITMGGHFPSACHEMLLKNFSQIDSIIRHEGEVTLLELLQELEHPNRWTKISGLTYRYKDKIHVNPPRDLISNLDNLPFPSRDFLPGLVSKGFRKAAILASRGCYGQCRFCSVCAFYRSAGGAVWRGRSPKNVVEEMMDLVEAYGINYFQFLDDNFFGPGRDGVLRAEEFADEILNKGLKVKYCFACRSDNVDERLFRRLKKVGLDRVFLGVESASQRFLDQYGKGISIETNRKAVQTLKKLGLDTSVGFIMVDPFATCDDIRQNISFLKGFDKQYIEVEPLWGSLMVYAGTAIDVKLQQEDLLHDNYLDLTRTYEFCDPKVALIDRIVRSTLTKWINLALYEKYVRATWSGDGSVNAKERATLLEMAELQLQDLFLEAILMVVDRVEEMTSIEEAQKVMETLSTEIEEKMTKNSSSLIQLLQVLRLSKIM